MTKAAKISARVVVLRCLASRPPTTPPTRMPGVMPRTMDQSTLPLAWCVRALEMEVNTMVVSEVPSARCSRVLEAKPWASNSQVSRGTYNMPPPMPSRPAAKPPAMPRAR
ncbi:hypothetical protein D9M68_824250 [compost metagenome]